MEGVKHTDASEHQQSNIHTDRQTERNRHREAETERDMLAHSMVGTEYKYFNNVYIKYRISMDDMNLINNINLL